MKHPLPDFQCDVHTCIFCFFRKSYRVIQKDFVLADVDEKGRKTVKVSVKRRYPWIAWVAAFYIVVAENGPRLRRG